MPYVREEIRGTSPQDIKKINDNMMNIWSKTFGDITYSDMDRDARTKVMTQWIPVQGEGNIDKTHPLYIRFYIPPNVQQINNSSFNILLSRYRMDSDVTSTQPSNSIGTAITSSSAPKYSVTSSSNASGIASVSGGQHSSYVKSWGTPPYTYSAPTSWVGGADIKVVSSGSGGFVKSNDSRSTLGTVHGKSVLNSQLTEFSDFYNFQHNHEIQSHSHAVTLSPHSHTTMVASHNHTVDIKMDIAGHTHTLNEGIKESKTSPSGVKMIINETQVSNTLSGDNKTQDNIDVSQYINIGSWNIIKIESSGVARATVYGTIELLIK